MLRRKTASPYFVVYSLLIHLILLLGGWQLVPKQVPLPPSFHEKNRGFDNPREALTTRRLNHRSLLNLLPLS